MVSSEWGYSTANVTEQQQAQFLTREWLSNLAEGIRLSIWYDWHDDGTDPKNGEHHFGTVRNDYSPKPAFLAAQTLTQTLGGYRFLKRIPLASPDDYLLLFEKGPHAQKLAAWTTREDHTIALPISPPARMTDMLGEDLRRRACGTVCGCLSREAPPIWTCREIWRYARPPPGRPSRWTRSTRRATLCAWR